MRADVSRVRPAARKTASRRPHRFQLLAVVAGIYLVFASSLAAVTAHVLHTHSIDDGPVAQAVTGAAPATPKYLVLMVLDGARPDYFNLASLPHVQQLRDQGIEFTQAVDGILESETPTGHATIATGSRPDQDGILGFDWGNDDDRYSLFSPDQMGNVEQILRDSHAPTIAGLYKQRYPGTRVVAVSGHKYYAAAPLGGPDADAILYYQGDAQGHYVPVGVPGHVPPADVLNTPGLISPTTHLKDGVEDDLATQLALAAFQKMRPHVLLINYPEFDWPLGHVNGGNLDQSEATTLMQGFDADLGKIQDAYRQAGILDQTLFVVTADHGMMPISRFIPESLVDSAIAKAGTTAVDNSTNSADYIWLRDGAKAQAVAENIANTHDPGIQSVYYRTTAGGKAAYLPADPSALSPAMETANQYLLSALLNGHEPSVVAFGREGASFSDPKSNWKGDHGGNSWQVQHIPLIISGPGIRAGVVSDTPAQLDDVAPTALAALGVRPAGMEGRVLTDALVNPSEDDQRARAAEIKQMQVVVNALADQERQEEAAS